MEKPDVAGAPSSVPDYGGWAWLSFFLVGLLTGIPALKNSLLVNLHLEEREWEQAVIHSRRARKWCWASGLAFVLLWGAILIWLGILFRPLLDALQG